jgi:hypothetical protein
MSHDKFCGIRRALKLAKLTRREVNIGIKKRGEGVKIEGIVKKVHTGSFKIRLETGKRKNVSVRRVEYVEYS